ncbi:MAG TPA: hypothetical protein DCG28_02825 [Lachnospiraceae bacterium]|nr:hypothetical protein [Lachnospiraceae bacterium]
MNEEIFRKKSIEKISSPEKLDDYIKVARPSAWLLLAAIIVLMIGALVWALNDYMDVKDENGNIKNIHPIEYVVNGYE